ncbi:unnamed protein product [Victoria cruziana]
MIKLASPEAQQQISHLTNTADAAAAAAGNVANQEETTFVFRSRLPDITVPDHLPLHAYCFEKSSGFGDRPCLIDAPTGATYSFYEVELTCRRVAVGLSKLGIGKGDTIMILLQNCPEFVFAFLGASMIGAVSTTANPFCMPSEIRKQFAAAGARLVVTQAAYVDKLREFAAPGEIPVVTTDDAPEGCLHFSVLSGADEREDIRRPEIGPEDAVALPFSSGTTGLPKGVVLTHRSLVTSVAQLVDGDNPNLHLTGDDTLLCLLPLFHIFSLHSVLLCSLRAGSAVLLMPKFEIGSLLELIARHKITVAPVVPPLVIALAKNPMVEKFDLSSIRIVLSGAAPLRKELEEALKNRLPRATFGQGYGMTEAGPVLSMCLGFAKQPFPTKSGSCGTVVRNAELKIINPETGVSLTRNQPGEICIRGAQIMKGYLNDPVSTSLTIDSEGWLHTGDVGYVDDDDEVFIVDRVKEIIKYKGFQVPPAELEALLISHPSISDAAVVPQKDEVAGEVPVAFVVRSNGFELTEEAVKDFIAKQVSTPAELQRD